MSLIRTHPGMEAPARADYFKPRFCRFGGALFAMRIPNHVALPLIKETIMKFFTKNVGKMFTRATQLGLQDRKGNPVVIDQVAELEAARQGFRNVHACKSALSAEGELVLDAVSSNEYQLKDGADDVWVHMGPFKVRLYFTDEGMVTDIYAIGADSESIASTYAAHTETAEAVADELEVDLDDVAEWVGLHYRRNFDAESPRARLDWIHRYHEATAEALAEASNPHLDVLEEIGYNVAFQLSTPTQESGWVWEAPSSACDEVFATEADAISDAWRDAASQAMAIDNMSDSQWDALSFEQQATHIREMVAEDKRISEPERQLCVQCGLPTLTDDDGLCNACSAN